MAALGHTVDPDGGGDYVSLNALEAAQEQDLTDGGGDTYTATCTSGGTADTTAVDFDGWTTAAANYIEIVAASGHEADADGWDAAKYRLSVTDADALLIREDHVRVINIQVEVLLATATRNCIRVAQINAGSDIRFDSCRVRATISGGNTRAIRLEDADIVAKIYNCILENLTYAGVSASNCSTADVYNCTIYNVSSFYGIDRVAGTVVAKNCAVFKNNDDFHGTITIDYCASDDNDGTNNVAESGGGVEWPSDFNDSANGDFTLLVGSGLVGNGTDNPGAGLYSDDINGDARTSTWDVGADEYIAAVGGLSIPIAMYYNRIRRITGD